MSIDQTKIIDSVNLTPDSKEIILMIFDHLDWVGDMKEHMYLLQEKVKTYLDFVEGGQLNQMSPEHIRKPITIKIIAKHTVPDSNLVNEFFDYLKKIIDDAGLKFDISVE